MQPLHSTDAADAQWQAIELPTRRPRCGRVEWLQRRVALRARLGRLGSDLAAVKIVKLVVVAARVVIALGSGGNAGVGACKGGMIRCSGIAKIGMNFERCGTTRRQLAQHPPMRNNGARFDIYLDRGDARHAAAQKQQIIAACTNRF